MGPIECGCCAGILIDGDEPNLILVQLGINIFITRITIYQLLQAGSSCPTFILSGYVDDDDCVYFFREFSYYFPEKYPTYGTFCV